MKNYTFNSKKICIETCNGKHIQRYESRNGCDLRKSLNATKMTFS